MILHLSNLAAYSFRRPLVLACGCFDLLTVGHVKHLHAARSLGEALAVLITADQHVNKGHDRPIFNHNDRAETVSALRSVDYAIINPYTTAAEAILSIKPQVYVKGGEYIEHQTDSLQQEIAAVHKIGGRVVFTKTNEVHSSEVIRAIKCM